MSYFLTVMAISRHYSGLVVDLSRDFDAGNVYTALACQCQVPPEDTLADPGEARGCSINTFVINRPGVAGAVLQTPL